MEPRHFAVPVCGGPRLVLAAPCRYILELCDDISPEMVLGWPGAVGAVQLSPDKAEGVGVDTARTYSAVVDDMALGVPCVAGGGLGWPKMVKRVERGCV